MRLKTAISLPTSIPILCGSITSLIVVLLMNRDFPIVGHDYRYFILRMLDTKLFMLLNGPAIQWYTPSFGGGLPAYPNPQQIQYSIVQFLALAMDPWKAVLLSTFLSTFVGFVAFQRFLVKVMNFHWTSSTLGAIFFIGNGFFIEHMIVGHIGHQLFPLGGAILLEAGDKDRSILKGGVVIALIVAMMIHQTGFYVLAILALSLAMLLPLILIYRPGAILPSNVWRKLGFGLILASLIASSKIHAVMAMMQLFPRAVSDHYAIGIGQALIGLVAQLLGAMFLAPFLLFTGGDVSTLSGGLSNITGAYYGIWETDIGLSPVLTVLLLVALVRLMRALRQRGLHLAAPVPTATWLILLAAVWLTIEMTFARGLFYPFIKSLPVIRSMHVNVRFAAAFILPLILIGIIEYERLTADRSPQRMFTITVALAWAALLVYNLLPADIYSRNYDLTDTLKTDAAIGQPDYFPVDHVARIEDAEVFTAHATNILYYEPLLSDYDRIKGYILSKDVVPQVHPGLVTEVEDGFYNMTNPASLFFPKENGLQPFERIKVGEEEQLRAFIERKQPDWIIPPLQRVLDWLSLVAFLVSLGLILLPTELARRQGAKTTYAA